ncbi:MAG: class I ribonucleotide reductase maintenance protein YfaE [Cardiobacteriaceae bacterium]|nr:class I ribonucleotide reductase maintenance protein YfaE [Cardiobacteriaceae bacterium]
MKAVVTLGLERIVLKEGETLLEGLERAGHDIEYQCRQGYCGSCRMRVISGDIHYPAGKPLAYLSRGEVLACCAVPAGDILLEEPMLPEEDEEEN